MMTKTSPQPAFRSPCPITTSLEIFGDKWTLIILRDLLNGKTKYNEFLSSPESITTNILAARLKTMTGHGIIDKKLYQSNPKRFSYHLTPKGQALHPVLIAMCHWADDHYEDLWQPPKQFMTPANSPAPTKTEL